MRCKSRNGSLRMIPSFKDNSATLAECFPKGIPLSTRGGREFLSIKGGCWEIKIHGSEIEIHFSKKEIHFSDNKGENHTSLRTACGFLFCAPACDVRCQGQATKYFRKMSYISCKTSYVSPQNIQYFSAKPPTFLCNTSYISCKTSHISLQQIPPFPQQKTRLRAKYPSFLKNLAWKCNHLPRNE